MLSITSFFITCSLYESVLDRVDQASEKVIHPWCWCQTCLLRELTTAVTQASPGAFKPYLEFYKSLLFILWFTALNN
jgi:hypothetical protein